MKKGISLIVLVITILVIIVLAGAVILTVVTNNPLEKANEGVFKSDLKTFVQELNMSIGSEILKGNDPYSINASGTNMAKYIESLNRKKDYLNILEIQSGELVYTGEEETHAKEIDWARQIGIRTLSVPLQIVDIKQTSKTESSMTIEVVANKAEKVKEYKLSKDNGVTYTAAQLSNVFNLTTLETGKEYIFKAQVIDIKGNTLTSNEYKHSTNKLPYQNPYDIEGFEYQSGSWDTGYVIKDKSLGNEFVWIPVKNISELVQTNFNDGGLLPGTEAITEDIRKSIETNGGFYRSRFETGVGNVSIKNVDTFVNITYAEGQTKASEMYNTDKIGSVLQYGAMWDVTLLWLEKSGYNVRTDSRSWGNFKNSIDPASKSEFGKKQKTGFSEYWKANNIYDLAGNIYEMTQEKTSAENYILRGSNYASDGTIATASRRYYSPLTAKYDLAGFSVTLYKK